MALKEAELLEETEEVLETDSISANNRKGGVGKTLLAGMIASVLAAMGFNVILIGGDSQKNVDRLDNRRYEDEHENPLTLTLTTVVTQNKTLLESVVQVRKRLWLIHADNFLGEAALRIQKMGNPFLLVDKVAQLKQQLPPPPAYASRLPWWSTSVIDIKQFPQERTTDEEYYQKPPFVDFIIWDTPPDDSALTDAILRASRVLVPIKMDQFSMDGLKTRVQYIQSTEADRDGNLVPLIAVLPNDIVHKPDNPTPVDFLMSVWRNFPDLARRPIHGDDALRDCWAYRMTMLEYASEYVPWSRGILEVTKLALEVAGWPGRVSGMRKCKVCSEAMVRLRAEGQRVEVGEEEESE